MVQTSLAGWLKKPLPKKDDFTLSTTKEIVVNTEEPKQQAILQPGRVPSQQLPRVDGDNAEVDGDDGKHEIIGNKKSLVKQPSPPKLPANASLASITADTLPAFRRMTALLLPVPYPDKFYTDILTDEVASRISMVALWSDPASTTAPRVVSGIRCRLVSHPAGTDPHPSLYISTITTLAPFRGFGLARELLRRIVRRAVEEFGIATVTAHMWEANEEAREWYEKVGFKEIKYEKDYYRKLKPGGAFLLERRVVPGDLLGSGEEV